MFFWNTGVLLQFDDSLFLYNWPGTVGLLANYPKDSCLINLPQLTSVASYQSQWDHNLVQTKNRFEYLKVAIK